MTEINRLQDTVRRLQSQRAAGMPASDESKQMQEALSGLQAHYDTYKGQREGDEFGVNVTPELLSYLENYAGDALNEAKSVASSMGEDAMPATASHSSETRSQDVRAKTPSDDNIDPGRPLTATPSQSPSAREESRRPLAARRTELTRPFDSTMNQHANGFLSPPPSRQGSSSNAKAGGERRGSAGLLQDKTTRRSSAFGSPGKSARKFLGKLAPSGWDKKAASQPTLDLVVQNAQWKSDEIATWVSSPAKSQKGNVTNTASRPFAELRKRNENAPSQGWTKARIAAWAAEPKDIPADSRPATLAAHDQSNSTQETPTETVLAAPIPIHPNREAPALVSIEESLRESQRQDDVSPSVVSSSAQSTNSEDVDGEMDMVSVFDEALEPLMDDTAASETSFNTEVDRAAAEAAWALDEDDLTPFDHSAYARQNFPKAN